MSRKPYAFQRENNDSRSQTVSNVWRDGICIHSQEVFVLPKWFSDIQEEDMREAISWFSDQERFESIGSMARVVFTVGKKHHLQVFISDLHSFEFLSLFFSHWKTILWQSCKKSIFYFFFGPCPCLSYWRWEERGGLDLRVLRTTALNASGLIKSLLKTQGIVLLTSLCKGADPRWNKEPGLQGKIILLFFPEIFQNFCRVLWMIQKA